MHTRNTYTTINISGNIVTVMTNFNERTNTLLYKNIISHTLFSKRWWFLCMRDGDRLLFWPKVLLSTIAALLPHLGLVAQLWVTEGPKPSVCRWFSIRHLVPNWLKPSVCWLYYCLTSTCFHCSSAYLHRCISWLTAWSRVNMLHFKPFNCVCTNEFWLV